MRYIGINTDRDIDRTPGSNATMTGRREVGGRSPSTLQAISLGTQCTTRTRRRCRWTLQPTNYGITDMRKRLPRARASNDPAGNRQTETEIEYKRELLPPGKGMQIARPTACAECPLRKDSVPGYLGGYSPEMYLEALHGDVSLACHASPGFKEGVIETQHVCTGVAAYRANVGHVCFSAAHRSTIAIGEDDRFFESPDEFYYHHKAGQEGDE